MKLQKAKKKIHDMRSSLCVIKNFMGQLEPAQIDDQEHFDVTQTSIQKLFDALEELSDLVDTDLQKKQTSGKPMLQ